MQTKPSDKNKSNRHDNRVFIRKKQPGIETFPCIDENGNEIKFVISLTTPIEISRHIAEQLPKDKFIITEKKLIKDIKDKE